MELIISINSDNNKNNYLFFLAPAPGGDDYHECNDYHDCNENYLGDDYRLEFLKKTFAREDRSPPVVPSNPHPPTQSTVQPNIPSPTLLATQPDLPIPTHHTLAGKLTEFHELNLMAPC